MSDQAIIALVMAVGTGISSFVYYLISNLKAALHDANESVLNKMDKFVDELGKVRESLAVKSTVIDFIQRDVETMKQHFTRDKKKE